MRETLYFSMLLLVFSACQPEPIVLSNIQVAQEFEPYVNSFIQEGAARGYAIDFSDTGLSITFGNVEHASASCSEIGGHQDGSHQIIVNQAAWEVLNDSLRERLIFHELGHCELNRNHRNDKFKDGSWKSIMRGDPLSLTEEKLPIPYFGFRRDYYINELFDEQTPLPDWANLTFAYEELSASSKQVLLRKEQLSSLQDTFDLELPDYELEFELELSGQDNIHWIAWGAPDQHYFFYTQGQKLYFSANAAFQGPFHFSERSGPEETNRIKLTVRQTGPFCKLFVNEEFFFMVDRLPADLQFVRSGTERDMLIESFQLSALH